MARLIDSHVHFPAIDFMGNGKDLSNPYPHKWLEVEKAKWRAAWDFPTPEKTTDEEAAIENWYQEAIKYDIDKIVFVTGGGNKRLSEIVSSHPDRFIGYAHHDPSEPDAAETLEYYIREKGLKGYKILAPRIDTPMNDKSMYPVWEVAQDLEIPVLIHFGIMGGAGGIGNHININPIIIHDVAKAFPKMNIIVPHFGCGYVFETLNLCWSCPNVVIDTSGSNQWMRWMPYEVTLQGLYKKYYETVGPERILFGTDSSWFPRGFAHAYLEEQMRAMVYSGFTAEERDLILYKNISNLLSLG